MAWISINQNNTLFALHFNCQFQGLPDVQDILNFETYNFYNLIVNIKAYETCKEAGWHPEEFDCDQEGNTLDCDWEDNVEVGRLSSDLFTEQEENIHS